MKNNVNHKREISFHRLQTLINIMNIIYYVLVIYNT